jgi:hypothetical protein
MKTPTPRNVLTSGQTPYGASADPHSAQYPSESGYLAGFTPNAIDTGEALCFPNRFWMTAGSVGGATKTNLNGSTGTGITSATAVDYAIPAVGV